MRFAALRDWMVRHPIRLMVYALLLIGIVSATVAGLGLCRNRSGLLGSLVNRPVFHDLAEEIGIRYSIRSLQACCLRKGCPWGVDVGAVDLEFTQQPLLIHLDRILASPAHGISVDGLQAGMPEATDLIKVDHIQADLLFHTIETQQVQVLLGTTPADSYLRTGKATVTGVSLPGGANHSLILGQVEADGIEVILQRGRGDSWSFERARSLLHLVQTLATRPLLSLDAAYRAVSRLRGILLLVVIGVAVLLVVVKLVLVRGLHLRWNGIFLVTLGVLVPVICHVLLFPHLSLIAFLLFSLLVSLAAAVLLQRKLYRAGAEWHQRWEPFAVDLAAAAALLPLLLAHGLLPAGPSSFRSIQVSATQLHNFSAALRDREIGEGDLASLVFPDLSTADFRLELDPSSAQLRSLNLGRGSFRGTVTGDLSSALRPVEWLPRSWIEPQQVSLCGNFRDLELPALPAQPEGCGSPSEAGPRITVNLAAGVALAQAAVRYSLQAHLQSAPLDAGVVADGDTQILRIGSVRTGPSSPLQIGGGSGTVRFDRQLDFNLTLGELRLRNSASLQSVGTHFFLPSLSDPQNLQFESSLQGLALNAGRGSATLRKAMIRFDQAMQPGGHAVSLEARFEGIAATGHRSGELEPWLKVELPLVRLQMTGRTPPGLVPKRLEGQGSLLIARTADARRESESLALWTRDGLRVSLDLRHGTFDVPDQAVLIHQSMVRQAPASLALRLSADGQLVSLGEPFKIRAEARGRIPKLVPDVLPFQAELNDLVFETAATVQAKGVNLTARYGSGWNFLTLPSVPHGAGLAQVSDLNLHTEGTVPVLPPTDELIDGATAASRRLRSLTASLSQRATFKLEGAWPAEPGSAILRLTGSSGAGIGIGGVSLHVTRFLLPVARLEALQARTQVSQIQTLNGEGNLNLFTTVGITGDGGTNMEASIPLATGDELAFKVRSSPTATDFELTKKLPLGSLMSRTKPFLKDFGFNLDGVTLKAQVDRLEGAARFSGTQLAGFDLSLGLAPGLLLSLDVANLTASQPPGFLKHLDVYSDSGNSSRGGLGLRIASNPATPSLFPTDVSVEIAPASLRAIDDQKREYRGGFSLSSKIRTGPPISAAPADNRVVDKLLPALVGLGRQFHKIVQLFGSSAPLSQSSVRDVNWQLNLHNRSAAQPVLSLDPEACALALAIDVDRFTWRTRERGEGSSVRSTIDIQTDLKLRQGELIADGDVPINADVTLSGGKPRQFKLRSPFLVLLADRLRPATSEPDALWNTGYYDTFWSGYQPAHAYQSSPSLLDARELVLGPLFIQQLRIPTEPFRFAVGYADGLEFYGSLAARVMFGRARGGLQARLRWLDPAGAARAPVGALDSRLSLSLENLQASAIGLVSEGGRLPLIDDQLDGEVKVRTDGLTLDRQGLQSLDRRRLPFGQLDRFGIGLKFWSAPGRTTPGIVQAISRVRLKSLNDLLQQVARGLQLQAPPRSLLYDSLSLNFEAKHGQVSPQPALFEMRGVKLFAADYLQLEGNLRVHVGTEAAPFSLRSLSQFAERALAAEAVGISDQGFGPGSIKLIFRGNR